MQGKYNINGDLLAQGHNCVVRVDLNDENGSAPVEVGFVQDYTINNNIQTQRAEVIGELLTISIDPTGIQVTITMKGFIPTKDVVEKGIESVRGGGTFCLKSFNPSGAKIADAKVLTKIPYIDFYDKKHQAILDSAYWLTATKYTETVSGKGYVMSDCSFEGLTCDNGSDYEAVI